MKIYSIKEIVEATNSFLKPKTKTLPKKSKKIKDIKLPLKTESIIAEAESTILDEAFQTDDTEALNLIYELIKDQNIILGGSSGINIAGAIKLAKKLGPGNNIVTILCDPGERYASKIYNKNFLKSKNLPLPKWL